MLSRTVVMKRPRNVEEVTRTLLGSKNGQAARLLAIPIRTIAMQLATEPLCDRASPQDAAVAKQLVPNAVVAAAVVVVVLTNQRCPRQPPAVVVVAAAAAAAVVLSLQQLLSHYWAPQGER